MLPDLRRLADDRVISRGNLPLHIVLGFVKFIHGLAETTSKFRQTLRPKEEQDHHQDHQDVWTGKIEEAREIHKEPILARRKGLCNAYFAA